MDFPTLFTQSLTLVTLLGNVGFLLMLIVYVASAPYRQRIDKLVSRYGLLLISLITTGATVGSLIYSEVVGFPACILCWIQRIFMYPQMFISSLGWYLNDRGTYAHLLLLSVLGGAVSVYHWVKDMLAVYSGYNIPCPAVSDLPSCDKIYVLEWGYVTIPMIALNAFLWVGMISFIALRKKKSEATD